MRKNSILVCTLALIASFSLVGCAKKEEAKNNGETNSAIVIEKAPISEDGGARGVIGTYDHEDSPYFKKIDFYNLKSNDNLTLLPKFKTYQQSSEWSCGNATSLMVMDYLGDENFTEGELAKCMMSHTDKDVKGSEPGSANNFGEYGTSLEQMVEFFENSDDFVIVETNYDKNLSEKDLLKAEDGVTPNAVGNKKPTFSAMSLYASENSDDTEAFVEDAKDVYFVKWLKSYLDRGLPVMVEWCDWGGHWQAIIGYDNMGTPAVADDVLIFADPYDTSDHSQDGYFIYPLERWFTMWSDYNIVQKPYQIQNYLVIDKK